MPNTTIKLIQEKLEEIINDDCTCTWRNIPNRPKYVYSYSDIGVHFDDCPRKKAKLVLELFNSLRLE